MGEARWLVESKGLLKIIKPGMFLAFETESQGKD